MKRQKLFCFSHAGGSAAGFLRWKRWLEPDIELCPVELKGRGSKANKAFYGSLEEAIEDLAPSISVGTDEEPFAFIGHSMGTLIAYEMAHYLRENKRRQPETIFFSGRLAPHIKEDEDKLHTLPDDQFTERIKALGHSPAELFQSPELLKIFIPILKADYQLIETYTYRERVQRLSSRFVILTGNEDSSTGSRIEEWRMHTEGECQFQAFEGGHFFLYENATQVIELIRRSGLMV